MDYTVIHTNEGKKYKIQGANASIEQIKKKLSIPSQDQVILTYDDEKIKMYSWVNNLSFEFTVFNERRSV